MHPEKHCVSIRHWSKKQILQKIEEIMQAYEYLLSIHVDAEKLEWEYLEKEPMPKNRLFNPSWRFKIE